MLVMVCCSTCVCCRGQLQHTCVLTSITARVWAGYGLLQHVCVLSWSIIARGCAIKLLCTTVWVHANMVDSSTCVCFDKHEHPKLCVSSVALYHPKHYTLVKCKMAVDVPHVYSWCAVWWLGDWLPQMTNCGILCTCRYVALILCYVL